MATRKGSRRRQRSLAIDAAVLTAATETVRQRGPDDLNISAVARAAGVTTGAVYSRYENAAELLVAVWGSRAGPALQRRLSDAAATATGDPAARRRTAAILAQRPQEVGVAIQLLTVARRIDELEEAILPDVRSWFADDPGMRRAIVPMSFALGAAYFDAIVGSPHRDWVVPLEWAARAGAPEPLTSPPPSGTSDLPGLLGVDTGDPVRDRVLEAAAVIIGRSGLKRATTSRIARAAGYTQSVVFQIWGTRNEFMSEATAVILAGMARSAAPFGLAAMAGDAAGAAAGLREILGPTYLDARRLRLELVLAATTDELIARVVNPADTQAATVLAADESDEAAVALRLAEAVRAVVLGLSLLQETVGGMDELDLTEPIASLLSVAPGAAAADEDSKSH